MSMEMNKALDLLREIRPSIPKEVLELWCKDRDAFLASHPAVEQAGGDERAALQELIRVRDWVKNRRGQPEKLKNTGQTYIMIEKCETLDMLEWAIERARAALAHRAPEVCSECSDTGKVYDESGDGPWSCYACTGNPEVIGYANGDELDNMLDDRTAVLSPGKTSFHTVPVYRLIRADLAQPSPKCATCGGTGMVDDGEIDCYSDGTPFENGPVKCVKDCPACKAQPSPLQAEQPTADDYEEVLADHRRLVRELDVLLNGEEGAAKQASLCDLVGQVAAIVRERRAPLLSPAQAWQVPDAQAVYDAFDSRERMFTSYENVSVVLAAQKRIAAAPSQAQHSVPEGLAEFSQFLSAVMDAAGLVRYGRRSKELSEYLGAQCMKYRLSAPVAQAGQVPAAWYYDAPSQAEAAIIDIRGMWGEDDCPTYEDVAAALRRLLAAAPGKEVPQAWLDVQAERRRQVEVEGYHGFRDNHYISYELSKAARAYIEVSWHALSGGLPCKKPESWPWMAGFKWSDGRTMLVKACALALAEIERLDRAAPQQGGRS